MLEEFLSACENKSSGGKPFLMIAPVCSCPESGLGLGSHVRYFLLLFE